MNRDFVGLLLLAALTATPVAHLAAQNWLEGFAYRVNPGPLPYIVAVVITAVTAFTAIGYHAIRAAKANPVESLR